KVTEAFERMPPRTRVRGIAATRRSRPSHGFSRQLRIITSNSEEPARSMTRKPLRSISGATGKAIPACMRMPHRLCCPSRMVSSRNSMCAMGGFLSLSVARQEGCLQPARVEAPLGEVGMSGDRAQKRDVGGDPGNLELAERFAQQRHSRRPV